MHEIITTTITVCVPVNIMTFILSSELFNKGQVHLVDKTNLICTCILWPSLIPFY